MKRNINIIVAVTADNAIGRGGDLVYRLRGDMKHFRELTMGHTIIMGRKTWESLPKGALPGRRNIVVSRNGAYVAPGADVYGSLEAAVRNCGEDSEVYIIGGAQIYAQALPLATRLYLTVIEASAPDADTFFPPIAGEEWRLVDQSENYTDENAGVKYRFICLSRK